jgi:sugar/nucleoside kinase (ribokinase family)
MATDREQIAYVIYGKIIIDEMRPRDGSQVRPLLGGGGPQAAFGARVWSDSVGLMTRSGVDLSPDHVAALRRLDVDLSGWRQFAAIPTPRHTIQYDAEEHLGGELLTGEENWEQLLAEPLSLPPSFQRPRAIHLVTEFPDEPMVQTALGLREAGTLVSLEPLPVAGVNADWTALLRQVDVVSPDWPTASRIAASDDPLQVLRAWSALGPALIAVRRGARGSYVWAREHDEAWHIPPVPVAVVDPTGAGNAYGGGLIVGWTETQDPRQAGTSGAISASLLVQHVGVPAMSAGVRGWARAALPEALAAARRL